MSSFHRRRFSRFPRPRRKKKTQEIKYKENDEAFRFLFLSAEGRCMVFAFFRQYLG